MESTHRSDRHLMVRLGKRAFGIPVGIVAEMVRLGPLTTLPRSAPHLRGVMLVRGQGVAVHDLRALLGMPPLADEVAALQELMKAREQDHRRWLVELEASVRERRPFTLATDPHRCAFGRWYDAFRSDNILVEGHLRKFDAPHRRIHALAVEVDRLVRDGHADEAMRRIEATRHRELSEMIALFAELHELLTATTTEIAVLLSDPDGRRIAYTVDVVEAVHEPEPASGADGGGEGLTALGQRCALYGPSRSIAVLLDASRLLEPRRLVAA